MTHAPSRVKPVRPPQVGVWVGLTVVAWHLAFFATGAVTLALASSPAGSVFEGLAEPFHQKVLLASHLRVLAGYVVVALGAYALAYPVVRLWAGAGLVSRWGVVARTLVVLAMLMAHGWLRLAHTQPYFLGPATYDTWYFRALGQCSEEVRERVLFVVFQFLPALVVVAALGVYVVEAARWFREGGRSARLMLAGAGTSAILIAGWLVAPHFINTMGTKRDGRLNIVMLSSDDVHPSPTSIAGNARQPRLAALAAESVVLTNLRSPLGTALGEASSLHTGQAPHTHGLQTPYPSRDSVEQSLAAAPLLPALLGAQGYATTVLGDDAAGAFAVANGLGFANVEAGATGAYPRHLAGMVYPAHFIIPAWLDNRLGRRLLPDLAVLPGCVSAETVTDRLTERLEDDAEAGTPFFVHGVYSQSSSAATPADGPASSPSSTAFDDQLGRILDCLEENGLRDNTILVVLGRSTADRLATKGAGAVRTGPPPTDTPVPVVFYVPGDAFAPGSVDQLARLLDLAPTLLDVLGLPSVPAMEGVSLRPFLENRSLPLTLAAYGESAGFPEALPGPEAPPEVRAAFRDGVRLDPASGYRLVLRDEAAAVRRKSRWIRTACWQLVFTPAEASPDSVDEWRLFDLRADPATSRDVKLQNPKVWQTLEVALRRWADEKKESHITELFPNGEPPAAVLPGA